MVVVVVVVVLLLHGKSYYTYVWWNFGEVCNYLVLYITVSPQILSIFEEILFLFSGRERGGKRGQSGGGREQLNPHPPTVGGGRGERKKKEGNLGCPPCRHQTLPLSAVAAKASFYSLWCTISHCHRRWCLR